jgi:small-conductance mechanosensitive channel
VIPNADLFTHPVTINTAFDARRWESEIVVASAGQNLADLKSRIVETVRQAEGVLPEPAPEAMAVDMGEPGAETVRIRISWWTRPRSHQMQTVHDHVITGLKGLLRELPSDSPASQCGRAA